MTPYTPKDIQEQSGLVNNAFYSKKNERKRLNYLKSCKISTNCYAAEFSLFCLLRDRVKCDVIPEDTYWIDFRLYMAKVYR